MNVPFVDLKSQYHSIQQEIDGAIQNVLENTSFIGGPIVKDFEQAFSNYLGVQHCVSCANGTDAIEIALQALGIGEGDEVIVPAMSWISTAEAVNTVGATPVFADILPEKFTIDPDKIRSKITERTKGIIPVHLYGKAAEMSEIMNIAKEFELKVIEDCAQAHGAEFGGQKISTFGDAATFSFYPGKNLGAYGDAGCIVSNNSELAEKCRMIANHGQLSKHNHQMTGRNSRLDTLQAAILKVKLKHIDEWTSQRIENAKYYNECLSDSNITLPVLDDSKHVFHLYVINIDGRDEIKTELQERGVATQIHYPIALPLLPPYIAKENTTDYPIAIALAKNGLSLPLFPELKKSEIEYVAEQLKSLL